MASVRLHVQTTSTSLAPEPSGTTIEVSKTGPGCRSNRYEANWLRHDVDVVVTPEIEGFRNPYLLMNLDEGALYSVTNEDPSPYWKWFEARRGARWSGRDSGSRWIDQPISHRESKRIYQWVADPWTIEGTTLRFSLRAAGVVGGRFDVTVKVYASDIDVTNPFTFDYDVHASETVHVTTLELALPPEAVAAQAECLIAQLKAKRFEWPPHLEEPGWKLHLLLPDLWRKHDFVVGGLGLVTVIRDAARGSKDARRLLEQAAKIFEVAPAALRAVGKVTASWIS